MASSSRSAAPHPTAVLLVAGLSPNLIGDQAPRLRQLTRDLGGVRILRADFPAVTCTVQSSMLTGLAPSGHGIVGNGWYDRESAEVRMWRQSNRLVGGEKVWETARARSPGVTCANLFWWFDMYSSAEYSVTPRPMYPADGRKIPDVYTEPPQLRAELQTKLGPFPLFHFWGPASDIRSTSWIASSAMHTFERCKPTLSLVYLPHMDYCLQKFGPGTPQAAAELRELDRELGRLIDFYRNAGVRLMIVSEYGIEAVDDAVHINQRLREAGLLRLREELGRDLLDPGASPAFAVVDHQAAHVYLRDPGDSALIARVKDVLAGTEGVEAVLDRTAQRSLGVDHDRAGDLVCVAAARRWFSYDWWASPDRAPDYARTVDIHRKPGYDPCELFIDPALSVPKVRIAWALAKRKLGFRALMNVVPLDPRLVRGSHGRVTPERGYEPLLIADNRFGPQEATLSCRQVREVILAHLFE